MSARTESPRIELEGIDYAALRTPDGLRRLDELFQQRLGAREPALRERLRQYRAHPDALAPTELSELLLTCAPTLEQVIAELFGIEAALAATRAATQSHEVVLRFKKLVVQRRARRRLLKRDFSDTFAELDAWLAQALQQAGLDVGDREHAVATLGERWLQDTENSAGAIERLTRWCVLALSEPAAQAAVRGWASFRLPRPIAHEALVPLDAVAGDAASRREAPAGHFRRRDGFKLTDTRMPPRAIQDEVHYCVYCHDHDGDFCAKGFPEKKGEPERGLKVNPLGVTLTGCPLEEKISEMHSLKRDGRTIAALAVAMIDNPMLPATGHRICNDCMKACIYQKQDPVNIPEIETRCLTDVLELPWGVEIYDLLTRWNPLRAHQYLPRPYNGRKVLIAGMGPAGFTMAHHLTMEGCAVVGIDGLKIEPLPPELRARPIVSYAELTEELDTRVMAGFGGVAEYGITNRWDKNFLKLIYLTLARRVNFQVLGGVRLGGTVTVDDAWAMGFDHLCLATGAGLPRVLPMGGSLARGMRQASDFLMALQLTGAAKNESLASLQVRLPAVVIGGGLTAIDTATEVQAYYIAQVEKTLARHERLAAAGVQVDAGLDEEHRAVLAEFLEHGRAVRAERARAQGAGEAPDFPPLIRAWGGVTVAYRKGLNESPAYTRNHEEIVKAMEEGIYYAEGMDPLRVELDRYGHVAALVCRQSSRSEDGRWLAATRETRLPARAVFVAAGALPNTIYEREHRGTFTLEGDHFLPHVAHDAGLQPVQAAAHCKAPEFGPFTSYADAGRRVSFIGDTHPVFHGSVVRAIASAKRTYPAIMAVLGAGAEVDPDACTEFQAHVRDLLSPRVAAVRRDAPGVLELHVRAPMAARNFRAGQFFRLQNFERLAPVFGGARMQTGPLTVSGAGIDGDNVRLLLLQGSAGARLSTTLRPDDPVVLMGPNGAPTGLPENGTVLVAAGRWGAAVMLALGPALRAVGNRVLYFGVYGGAGEVVYQNELEQVADQIVWCTAGAPTIAPRRAQDTAAAGDFVDILRRYAAGDIAPADRGHALALAQVDQMLLMGSTGLLYAMRDALRADLGRHFPPHLKTIAAVGSPMQCMLQGVCAQCLQWQIDPDTGKRTRAVFSCAEQDQPLQWLDLDNLRDRMGQNRLADRLNMLWLDHLFSARP